jgi:hypothetical protein
MTRGGAERAHRDRFHQFLTEKAGLSGEQRLLRPTAWALSLAWFFLALGPGAVLATYFFGPPSGGLDAWVLGVPSIWAWQFIAWMLGVLVIWFLAYRMGLSTAPAGGFDYGRQFKPPPLPVRSPLADRRNWLWAAILAGALVTLIHWMFGR